MIIKSTSKARERLSQAAADLLWERCFHAITLDDICTRANLKKGSFYYYFTSKSALVVAALQYLWDTVEKPAYETHFSGAVAPLQRMRNFLTWLRGLQCEKRNQVGYVLGSPFFSLGCELGSRTPDISRKLCELQSAQRRYFESAIRDAVTENVVEPCDSDAQALYLQALIDGILSEARIMDDIAVLKVLPELPMVILRLKSPTGRR